MPVSLFEHNAKLFDSEQRARLWTCERDSTALAGFYPTEEATLE